MKMKKNLSKYLAGLLVAASIMSVGTVAKAAYAETVLYQWDEVVRQGNMYPQEYTTNHVYKTIRFMNGYTYTESVNSILTMDDILNGFLSIRRHFRNYSTY